MPTASSLKLRERSFRERLLDLAGEHENLQERYEARAAEFEVEKRELKAEIAHLREKALEGDAPHLEALELRSKVAELSEELSRLRSLFDEREEQRLRAEDRAAQAELQASRAKARLESELAAKEARSADAARAKADADAKTQSDTNASQTKAARAKEEASGAARAREEGLAENRLQADAWAKASSAVAAPVEGDASAKAFGERQQLPSATAASEPSTEVDAEKASVTKVTRALPRSTGDESQDSEARKDVIVTRLPTVSAISASPWIGSYKHSSSAKARLFVLYGAGFAGTTFGPWQSVVQKCYPEIELAVFEYPGHGCHVADFVAEAAMFEQAFDQQVIQLHGLDWYFNCPFALIGLSMGARLGVNMIKALHRLGAKPEKFYVVGRTPPLVPDTHSSIPSGPRAFLRWVSNTIVPSKKETYEKMWSEMDPSDLKNREQMWRADLQLNSSPVAPLPRKWLVGEPAVLIKKPMSDPSKMIRIAKEVGTPVFVTGEELIGDRGDRWVQIDTSRADVKPGWYLTNGRTVGIHQDLLEQSELDDEMPNEQSLYWKAPVPFRVYHSTADKLHAWEDATGRLRPMREWSRLSCFEPEFVEYDGLSHDELLSHVDILHDICSDFVKFCRLR